TPVKVRQSPAAGPHGSICAIDTRIPPIVQYRIGHRATASEASSRAWTSRAARQPTLLEGPASSRKRPRRCRSYANGDMDDGPADWRLISRPRGRPPRGAGVRQITGRFLTTSGRFITFFSVGCLNEYFWGHK